MGGRDTPVSFEPMEMCLDSDVGFTARDFRIGSNFPVKGAFNARPELVVKQTKPIESGPLACDFPLLGAGSDNGSNAPYGEK